MMNIHFIRPFLLLALLPMACYLLWVIYATRPYNPWRRICDSHLISYFLQEPPVKPRYFFNILLFLVCILVVFALAGPSWKKAKLPVYRDLNSFMLVLDLSPTMQSTDLKPNRLSRAKFKIRDLIETSPNSQMGLVVFSGESFVASPLTLDAKTLSALLDELYPQIMPLAGADMGQGLDQALILLKQAAVQHSTVLLITANEPTANSWEMAKAIRQAGNQLSILAMLEKNNTNESTLSALNQLAKTGGGTLQIFTADNTDIQAIAQHNQARQIVKDENTDTVDLWQDAGPWVCLLLLPLVLLVLREKVV